MEICYVSLIFPKILFNIGNQDKGISVMNCSIQMCFFLMLRAPECFLLAMMRYDCYMAIYNPPHYPIVINPKECTQLAAGSWLGGPPVQIEQTSQTFSLHFCNSNHINHSCDLPSILRWPLGIIQCMSCLLT